MFYTPHSQRAQLAVFHRQQHTGEERGVGSSVLACQRPVLTPPCPGCKPRGCVKLCGNPKGRPGASLSPPPGGRGLPSPLLSEGRPRPRPGPKMAAGASRPPPPKMAAGGLARRARAGASRGGGRGRSRQVRGAAGPGPRGSLRGGLWVLAVPPSARPGSPRPSWWCSVAWPRLASSPYGCSLACAS